MKFVEQIRALFKILENFLYTCDTKSLYSDNQMHAASILAYLDGVEVNHTEILGGAGFDFLLRYKRTTVRLDASFIGRPGNTKQAAYRF